MLMQLSFVVFGHKWKASCKCLGKYGLKKKKRRRRLCKSHYQPKLNKAKFKRKELSPFLVIYHFRQKKGYSRNKTDCILF